MEFEFFQMDDGDFVNVEPLEDNFEADQIKIEDGPLMDTELNDAKVELPMLNTETQDNEFDRITLKADPNHGIASTTLSAELPSITFKHVSIPSTNIPDIKFDDDPSTMDAELDQSLLGKNIGSQWRTSVSLGDFDEEVTSTHAPLFVSITNDDTEIQCGKCPQLFSDQDSYTKHFDEVHRSTHHCFYCNEEFNEQVALERHKSIEHPHQTKYFLCRFCKRVFLSQRGVDRHMDSKHADLFVKFQCTFCLKMFKTEQYLQAHLKNYHNDQNIEQALMNSRIADPTSNIVNLFEFRCSVCKMAFNVEAKLKEHKISAHSEVNATQIKEKSRPTDNNSMTQKLVEYSEITQAKLSDEKFECELCCRKFISKYWLETHVQQCNSVGLYCKLCSITFVNFNAFKQHKSLHEARACYFCPGKKFASRQTLFRHIRNVHNYNGDVNEFIGYSHQSLQEALTCQACMKQFKSLELAKDHKDKLHGFHCNECDLKFITKSDILHHIKGHFQQFECKICHELLNTQQILWNHTKSEHRSTNVSLESKQEMNIFCNRCSERCKDKIELKLHLQEKHNLVEMDTIYHCALCSKSYLRKRTLAQHMRSIHHHKDNVMKFRCELCTKVFSRVSDLKSHKNNIHKGNGTNFYCNFCRKYFKYKKDYHKHKQSFHLEKTDKILDSLANENRLQGTEEMMLPTSFDCQDCRVKYETLDALKEHNKLVHPWRTFTCGICGKAFRNLSNMKKHASVHVFQQHFQCSKCPLLTFDQLHLLKIHIKNIHGSNAAAVLVRRTHGLPNQPLSS